MTNLIFVLMVFSGIVAAAKGVGSLTYSEHEEYVAGICQLPTDILYKYILIGRANENGNLVSNIWLQTKYYDYDSTDNMVARLGSGYSWLRRSLENSVKQNFNLHLADIRPLDKDIVLTIKGYKEECSDSKRRSTLSERLNDFFRFFGIATFLALLSWLFYQTTEKLTRRINRPDS